MAKKKGKKKTSRRRRIGAMSFNANSPIVKFGSIAVGFLMADKINAAIDKVTGTNIDGKIVAAGELGIGAYYLFMHKGKKNVAIATVTGLLAGAGIKRGMTSFGIGHLLAGYGQVPVIGRRVAGYGKVPVLGNAAGSGYVAALTVPRQGIMAGAESGSGITNTNGSSLMC